MVMVLSPHSENDTHVCLHAAYRDHGTKSHSLRRVDLPQLRNLCKASVAGVRSQTVSAELAMSVAAHCTRVSVHGVDKSRYTICSSETECRVLRLCNRGRSSYAGTFRQALGPRLSKRQAASSSESSAGNAPRDVTQCVSGERRTV